MPSSSRNFLKTSFKSLTSSRKDYDNTHIIVALSVLLFSIIVGIILYNSYKREGFTNNSNKLYYLYMENCHFCNEFNPIWDEMVKEQGKHNLTLEKYELNKSDKGKDLATQTNVNYAPAIILMTPTKNYLYEKERNKEAIFKWASTLV
jgi:hypothetical protein